MSDPDQKHEAGSSASPSAEDSPRPRPSYLDYIEKNTGQAQPLTLAASRDPLPLRSRSSRWRILILVLVGLLSTLLIYLLVE